MLSSLKKTLLPPGVFVTSRLIESFGPGWVRCHGPAEEPRPLLLSTSICLMDCGGLGRGPCLLPTIHTTYHTHLICLCNSVMFPSVHMTYIAFVHQGEGSSSVALLKVSSLSFTVKGFFLFVVSFSWSDVRSWDRGMCTDCNWALQNKLNWIDVVPLVIPTGCCFSCSAGSGSYSDVVGDIHWAVWAYDGVMSPNTRALDVPTFVGCPQQI